MSFPDLRLIKSDDIPEPTIEQRLRWALEKYGRHLSGCEAVVFGLPCNCGFHKALADFDPDKK